MAVPFEDANHWIVGYPISYVQFGFTELSFYTPWCALNPLQLFQNVIK